MSPIRPRHGSPRRTSGPSCTASLVRLTHFAERRACNDPIAVHIKWLVAGFVLLALSACGSGGGSSGAQPSVLPAPNTGSASRSNGVAMTLSFTLAYASGTTTSSSTRGPMLVSPSTTAIYISLETTAGQGNSTFSYAEPVNATVCPNETCSYSIQMPVGSDLIPILTAYTGHLQL